MRCGGVGLLFVCLFHQLLKFFLLIIYLLALRTIQMLNYLTNTFHVYVSLLSNRSQTTSKCYKNNRVAHEAIAECVTAVLTMHILTSSVIFLTNRLHVAVRLFNNRSQMTSKCGKNKRVAHRRWPSVSLSCSYNVFTVAFLSSVVGDSQISST